MRRDALSIICTMGGYAIGAKRVVPTKSFHVSCRAPAGERPMLLSAPILYGKERKRNLVA